MSLILEALQQSAEEGGDGSSGPSLTTRHSSFLPENRSPWYRQIVLAAMSGAVLVLAALWLLRTPPAPTPDQMPQPQAGVVAVAPAPAQMPLPQEQGLAAVPAPAAVTQMPQLQQPGLVPAPELPVAMRLPPPESSPAAAPTLSASARLPQPPEPGPAVAPTPPVAAQPQQSAETLAPAPQADLMLNNQRQQIASLYQQFPMAESTEVESAASVSLNESGTARQPATPALDVEAIAKAARQQLAADLVAAHPAPLLVDLPVAVKDEIPTIFFRQHDWSAQASARSVNLNGEVYREGDQVAPALQLLEIHPDFILMDFRGNEFLLRALNSWVNF